MRIEMTEVLSTGRRLVTGLALAGLLGVSLVGVASAQDNTAASGNGGTVDASSNGGAVSIGGTNSGDSTGSTTVVAGATAEDIISAVYESLGLPVPE